MDTEILLSWISEYAYCKRRFYLRAVECNSQLSADMVEGKYQHRVVDEQHIIRRGAHIVAAGLSVFSEKLGLYGFCDNVEFDENEADGVNIPFLNGLYSVCPVEFKHGKVRQNETEYEQQLCAQGLCLEEMYGIKIQWGVIYYVDSKSRVSISFADEMRNQTKETIGEIRQALYMIDANEIPDDFIKPVYKKRCTKCALLDVCNPKVQMVNDYIQQLWKQGER